MLIFSVSFTIMGKFDCFELGQPKSKIKNVSPLADDSGYPQRYMVSIDGFPPPLLMPLRVIFLFIITCSR
jgi:hypothetical protein